MWLIRNGVASPFFYAYLAMVWRYHLKYVRSANPVIVYQMGKVGSITVARSLAYVMQDPVLHAHHLTEEWVRTIKEAIERRQCVSLYARKIAHTRYIQELVRLSPPPKKKWKIITLVRDPVARSISAFFHKLNRDEKSLMDLRDATADEKLHRLMALFRQKQDGFHQYLSTWFDAELNQVFGIDVFADDFPKEKGYHFYHGERADVLAMRLEDLSRCYAEAFRDFLGLQNVSLLSSNTADDKGYRDIYGLFEESFRFDPDFLERMYSLRYVRHFYCKEEIDKFLAKWSHS